MTAVSIPVSDWWCCMSEAKRGAVVGIFDIWLLGLDVTPRALVDAVLTANGFTSDKPSYDLFYATFQLGVVGIEIDGVEVDVIVWDDIFETSLLDYRDETGFDCDEPCYVLKFALQHATGA